MSTNFSDPVVKYLHQQLDELNRAHSELFTANRTIDAAKMLIRHNATIISMNNGNPDTIDRALREATLPISAAMAEIKKSADDINERLEAMKDETETESEDN